jgi:MscS family membrane protein
MVPRLTTTMFLLSLMLAPVAFGQMPGVPQPKPPAEASPASQDALGRDTPRGTVLGFIRAANADNLKRAAQYLDTQRPPKQAEQLARELKVVLDRRLSPADLDQLGDQPGGNLEDDLPPNLDRVGTVESIAGTLDIQLERVQRGGKPPIWLFSASTLKGVPAVYDEIRPLWIEQFLWKPLRDIHFLDLALWQWIVLPVAAACVLVFAWLLSRVLFAVLRPLLFWLTGQAPAAQLARITAPVRLVVLSVVLVTWLSATNLPLLVRFYTSQMAVAVGIVGLAWLLVRLVDVFADLMRTHLQYLNQPGRIAITHLLQRLSKALVIVIGGLALLYLAGVDLTAALAGLGIGGIAVAFAAQKTLESLFGGILIISDQPVRVGDFCKVGNVLGTVEQIGLRSTRIRTLDRTVVSIPNGQMASENLENYGVRDKIWFRPTIGLRYETRADQLRYVLAEVRRMLYEHPMVETSSARIRFVRFGGSSLDLDVFAYVLTSDYARFLEVQEDLLLRIMDIVEASGTGVAFPSSTTYLSRDSGLDETRTQKAVEAVRHWREKKELPFPNFHPVRISEFKDRIEYPPADSALHESNDVGPPRATGP